jgi:hypothetical protein
MMKLPIMAYAVYPLLLLIYHEIESMVSTVEQLCWSRWRILHIFYIFIEVYLTEWLYSGVCYGNHVNT